MRINKIITTILFFVLINQLSYAGQLPKDNKQEVKKNTINTPLFKAESSFSIWSERDKNAWNYLKAHMLSNRFETAYIKNKHIIFWEKKDYIDATNREVDDGIIIVEAYEFKTGNKTPLWKIKSKGLRGDFLFGLNAYRVEQASCCDSSEREIYYDLYTGKELFSTTSSPLVIKYDDEVIRYVGYDDGAGNGGAPPEMDKDKSISGILYFAGDGIKTKKLAIFGNPQNEYRQQDFEISVKGKTIPNKNNLINAYLNEFVLSDGLVLTVEMFCRCETNEKLEIPIVNDKLIIEKAVLSKGITIKELP